MPTRNDLYDPEADAVRRTASPDTKPQIEDVPPQSPQAGGKLPPSRLPLDRARSGDQDSKGVARRFRRVLIEPAFIAGAGMAGALIEFSYGRMPGDNPVIGTAAAAASVAITVRAMRLLKKEGSRGGWKMVGGLAVRCALVLLCFGIELGLVVLLLLPVAMAPWVPRLGFEYWVTLAGNALGMASLYLEGRERPPPPACQSAHWTGPGRAGLGGSGRTGG